MRKLADMVELGAVILALGMLFHADGQEMPKSFKLDGDTWKIKYESDAKMKADGDELAGLTDTEINTIFINSSLTKAREKEVLFHELFHAAINSSSAEFICHRKFDEHQWIYKTSPRLLKMFKDNPELLKYFGTQGESK